MAWHALEAALVTDLGVSLCVQDKVGNYEGN